MGHNLNSSKCYSFDFIHEEFSCLNGQAMTKIIPRSNRLHIPMKLFTIFRHPIERICAQAFYGENSVGYFVMSNIIRKNCFYDEEDNSNIQITHLINMCKSPKELKENSQSNLCKCLDNSYEETFRILKENETLWFEWFNTSQHFNDGYMPNYHIKRLLTGRSHQLSNSISILNNCLENISQNCTGIELLRFSSPASRCLITPLPNYSIALNLAKNLLENHFEFLIMEKSNDPSTPYFFSNLLNEPNISLIIELRKLSRSRPGIVTLIKPQNLTTTTSTTSSSSSSSPSNLTFKYQSILPQSVLDFLIKDNHEDLQLYNYATKLYHKRIKQIIHFSHVLNQPYS